MNLPVYLKRNLNQSNFLDRESLLLKMDVEI